MLPAIPVGYLDDESHQLLQSFEARVLADPSGTELIQEFPFVPVEQRLVNTWKDAGVRLYANWLRLIQRRRQRGA